jgi:CubicO group peptidase (beta-lactamase class C family)
MVSKFATVVAALITIAPLVLQAQAGMSQSLPSQSLPDSIKTKVDRIFSRWDSAGAPGCVVGIVRNDSLIYARGYGLANVEDNVPNTPQSVYYICSLAKQFTGYAIVLLARQGKLKLDDDIHLYLPWMADFGQKITIRNLLNHTSGIRDEADMAEISGSPLGQMLTQQIAVNLIKRERTLNFIPGEKYAYSNSNYVLLAEIVKVASGEEFSSFVAQAIFTPLGMTHSSVMDDNRNIIKLRASSYNCKDASYCKNAFEYANVLGAGSLFSTVEDMARWAINFYLPRVGDARDIEQLAEKGKLNNGEESNYALGISVDSSRGWKVYSHNGGLAGFRTHIRIYPDLKTGIIIFSNAGDDRIYNTAGSIAEIFIPDNRRKPMNTLGVRTDSSAALLKNPGYFKSFEGDYLAGNGFTRNFSISNNMLWMNKRILMIQVSGDTITEFGYPEIKYIFQVSKNNTTINFFHPYLKEPQPLRFVKLVKGLQLPYIELQAYTGTYYSHELLCSYQIVLKDNQLFYSSNLYPEAKITLMGKNDLLSDYDFFSHVKILRTSGDKISGFEVSNPDTRNLKFEKLE